MNEYVAKYGLISGHNSHISGMLTVTQGVTASLSGLHIGNTIGTSSYAESASFATTASASAVAYTLNFVPNTAASASWVSASVKIITADTASYVAVGSIDGTPLSATSASFASESALAFSINFVPNTATTSTQSVYANSSSWVSASVRITTADTASYVTVSSIDGTPLSAISSSYASASGVANSISFTPIAAESSSWSSASLSASHTLTSDSADAITFIPQTAVSASWASASVSASYAQTVPTDLAFNSLSTSFFSGSELVLVPSPSQRHSAVTKEYVDSVIETKKQYYFRTGSAGIDPYYAVYDLNTPLSSSVSELIINAVSSSQILFGFITRPIGITAIPAGDISVHYYAYIVNSGGSRAINLQTQFYLYSGGNEYLIAQDTPTALGGGVNDNYTDIITLTASLPTSLTDRVLVKFVAASAASSPNVMMKVDGDTSAGFGVPISIANFVLKTGDIMSGDLTAPGFSGSLFGTASYAYNTVSASYAPSAPSISSSYAKSSSHSDVTDVAINAGYASTAGSAAFADEAGVAFTAESASFASASLSASYAPSNAIPVQNTALTATQSIFATQSVYATRSLFTTQSLYATTSLSASSVTATGVVTNANYPMVFISNSGSGQSLFTEGVAAPVAFNPSTGHIINSDLEGTASWANTASLATSASYAITASKTLDIYGQYVSGSNFAFSGQGAIAVPFLSFSISPDETVIGEIYTEAFSGGAAGMNYAISCSVPIVRNFTGWVIGSTGAVTATSRARLALNVKNATAFHASAGVKATDQIWFCLQNYTSSATVSLAVAAVTSGQTQTIGTGSFMLIRRNVINT